jgi:hypothetical protein
MSSIVVAGDTSGTVTIAAPAVAGSTTLTLQANTGNIPVVTGTGTSGQFLTSGGSGAVSTWTTASSGGLTLLGTLTTTSGTTQTLSSLTLTNYKALQISANNVGFSSADTAQSLRLAGVNLIRAFIDNASSVYGTMQLDLSTGGFIGLGATTAGLTNSAASASANIVAGNLSSITTSTTSISFTWTAGQAFTSGTIKVYGVA